MPRGRSIDPHLPVTRSIQTQREFRARRYAKLQHLESEVERLTLENDALKRELDVLRSRQGGGGMDEISKAREQVAAALQTLDAALLPRPGAAGCSSSAAAPKPEPPAAAVSGRCAPSNGCCDTKPSTESRYASPNVPRSAPPASQATTPASVSTAAAMVSTAPSEHARPPPPPLRLNELSDRRDRGSSEEQCCGGLFDCDAMIRSAVDPRSQ